MNSKHFCWTFQTFTKQKIQASFLMDDAHLQYGTLSKQQITLQDLTIGSSLGDDTFDERNNTTIHALRLNHVYRPTIKIFADISNSQKLVHKCIEEDFICNFWTCDNNEIIPANAVCNGTNYDGKSDCSDGSDESNTLCKGTNIQRNYIIIILLCHIGFGVFSYGKALSDDA